MQVIGAKVTFVYLWFYLVISTKVQKCPSGRVGHCKWLVLMWQGNQTNYCKPRGYLLPWYISSNLDAILGGMGRIAIWHIDVNVAIGKCINKVYRVLLLSDLGQSGTFSNRKVSIYKLPAICTYSFLWLELIITISDFKIWHAFSCVSS